MYMFRRAETHKCRIGFDKLVSSQRFPSLRCTASVAVLDRRVMMNGMDTIEFARNLTRDPPCVLGATTTHNLITVHLALFTPFCHARPPTHAYFLTSSGVGPTGVLDAAKLH